MRVNVSVLIGCVMCILLIAGISLMSRLNESQSQWSPNDIYSHVGGSAYSGVSSSQSFGSSDGVAVSMRGGSRLSRRVVAAPAYSYAHGYSAPMASTQYPIGGTPSNSVASPVYTTSSATYKSFGGGMMSSGATASSASRAATSQLATANISMPSVPNYAVLSSDMYSSASSAELQAVEAMTYAASYTPIASSFTPIGASSASSSFGSGAMFGPRRNSAPTGGGWDAWLNSFLLGGGVFVYTDDEGNRYYDMAALKAAWEAAKANGDFANGNMPGWQNMTWEDFLALFFNSDDPTTHRVPLGEPWLLLFLALAYVAVRWSIPRSRARA